MWLCVLKARGGGLDMGAAQVGAAQAFPWAVCRLRRSPSRRRAVASNRAMPAVFAVPLLRASPTNQTAGASLAQRTPAAADRPSGTDVNRVAAARTTGLHRKSVPGTTKHTGRSPQPHPHTRAPGPLAGSKGLPTGNCPHEGEGGLPVGTSAAAAYRRNFAKSIASEYFFVKLQ
jgi:hypothetical protein